MSEKTLRPACPLCVTWACSTCGHKRSQVDARWVNPSCSQCGGTDGLRLAVRHLGWMQDEHLTDAAAMKPFESITEDGMIFRWPAPFLDEVPKPGVLTAKDLGMAVATEPRYPDGTCATAHLLGRSFIAMSHLVAADVAKSAEAGTVTWSELLLARVLAALSLKDPGNIRHHLWAVSELIDEWTEELDRRIG